MRLHNDFRNVSSGLRTNILEFYRGLDVPPPTKKQVKAWRAALQDLEVLRRETNQQQSAPARTGPQQPPGTQ